MPPRDTITKALLIAMICCMLTWMIIITLSVYDVLPPSSRAGSYALITLALLGIALVTNDPSIAQRYPRYNHAPISARVRVLRWLLPIAFFLACLVGVNGVVILVIGGSAVLAGLIILVRQARQQFPDFIVWPIAAFCVLAAIFLFGMMLRVVQSFNLL